MTQSNRKENNTKKYAGALILWLSPIGTSNCEFFSVLAITVFYLAFQVRPKQAWEAFGDVRDKHFRDRG